MKKNSSLNFAIFWTILPFWTLRKSATLRDFVIYIWRLHGSSFQADEVEEELKNADDSEWDYVSLLYHAWIWLGNTLGSNLAYPQTIPFENIRNQNTSDVEISIHADSRRFFLFLHECVMRSPDRHFSSWCIVIVNIWYTLVLRLWVIALIYAGWREKKWNCGIRQKHNCRRTTTIRRYLISKRPGTRSTSRSCW